jgi:hypothetical protein
MNPGTTSLRSGPAELLRSRSWRPDERSASASRTSFLVAADADTTRPQIPDQVARGRVVAFRLSEDARLCQSQRRSARRRQIACGPGLRGSSPASRAAHRFRENRAVSETREPLRRTFDTAADLYEAARPSYPDELFDDLVELAALEPGDRLLEIGCATGKATRSLLERGFSVVCVELGAQLRACAPQLGGSAGRDPRRAVRRLGRRA